MLPFAALQNFARNLAQGQIRPAFRRLRGRNAMKGTATNQQTAPRADLIGNRLQLTDGKILRGYINKIALTRIAMLPPQGF